MFYLNKQSILFLLLGQFLSLCITTSNITTGALVDYYDIRIPTTQSFINYLLLMVIFGVELIRQKGINGYKKIILEKSGQYLKLALCDVEANYFIVKGFGFTSYLSAMLINACSTPAVVILSYKYLNVGYYRSHIIGILIALIGLVLLVLSDVIGGKNYEGSNRLLGDLFCILGALLYAISNTMEEFILKDTTKVEVLALLGLYGSFISGIQLFLLEWGEIFTIHWSLGSAGLYLAFTISIFSLYSLVPVLIENSGATFYNLSLLTADFYGLILGLLFLPVKINELYPFAFLLVMLGLIVYNINPTYHRVKLIDDVQDAIPLWEESSPLMA